MGMYDYVHVEIACPVCGNKVDNFKTHNLQCNFSVVDASEVYSFTGICSGCSTAVDFFRDTPAPERCIGEPKGIEYIESLGFKMSVFKLE